MDFGLSRINFLQDFVEFPVAAAVVAGAVSFLSLSAALVTGTAVVDEDAGGADEDEGGIGEAVRLQRPRVPP